MVENYSTLVYSSEKGKIVSDKKQNLYKKNKQQNPPPSTVPADGVIRLRRETKGRGGGTVIVITGVPGTPEEIKEVAAQLKKRCGCGGTIKNGIIEIQGDHRTTILQTLTERGFVVKLAGG